jgi:hypothetical protein
MREPLSTVASRLLWHQPVEVVSGRIEVASGSGTRHPLRHYGFRGVGIDHNGHLLVVVHPRDVGGAMVGPYLTTPGYRSTVSTSTAAPEKCSAGFDDVTPSLALDA